MNAPGVTFAPCGPEDFEVLHEIRVAAMRGSLERLGRFEPARSRERLTRSLQGIDEAAGRLATLTQDLLDVSRIRLGQLPLRAQDIDLAELVDRAAQHRKITRPMI